MGSQKSQEACGTGQEPETTLQFQEPALDDGLSECLVRTITRREVCVGEGERGVLERARGVA